MHLKNGDHVQQQVAKIHGIQFPQTRLILIIDFGTAIVECRCLSRWHFCGRPGTVFPMIYDSRHLTGGPSFFINIIQRKHLFDQANLIVGVQNGEIAFQPHQFGMTAQQLDTNRMERSHPWHAFHRLPQKHANTIFHFARRFVGKCHRQNFIRTRTTGGQQMHNAAGQCLGLARSCTRKHQNRTIQCFDGLSLRGVQIIQIRGRSRGHRTRRQACPFKGI